MQLLIAGGARHARHGPKIREWSRAEGEALGSYDFVFRFNRFFLTFDFSPVLKIHRSPFIG